MSNPSVGAQTETKTPELLAHVNDIDKHINRLEVVSNRLDNSLNRIRQAAPVNEVQGTEAPALDSSILTDLLASKNDKISRLIGIIEVQMDTLDNYV